MVPSFFPFRNNPPSLSSFLWLFTFFSLFHLIDIHALSSPSLSFQLFLLHLLLTTVSSRAQSNGIYLNEQSNNFYHVEITKKILFTRLTQWCTKFRFKSFQRRSSILKNRKIEILPKRFEKLKLLKTPRKSRLNFVPSRSKSKNHNDASAKIEKSYNFDKKDKIRKFM